jgi:gamma-glutamyl hercynylcysteine S-oxide synthase
MPTQRSAVVRLPERLAAIAGVIRDIRMVDDIPPPPIALSSSAAELAAMTRGARTRLLAVVGDLDGERLIGPFLPIVNPIVWEIGHVGWFHEYWTLRKLDGRPAIIDGADALYDSSAVAHATRWTLALPDRTRTLAYLGEVLDRQLARLDRGVRHADRYFHELAALHEEMHVEALTYTRQTLGYPAPRESAPSRPAGSLAGDAAIAGGAFMLGATAGEGFVFDNEKWAHEVVVAPFRMARACVSNRDFAAFVAAGGYRDTRHWSEAGWQWRARAGAERPRYWLAGEASWRRYDREEALAPDAPVCFVNWYEADAYCRWAQRRLPSEAEWEFAATMTPQGQRRRHPWGGAPPTPNHANLDSTRDGTLDVGALPEGDSAWGCRQMIGNVWEWTASDFLPFTGFSPDPYHDYSVPWFATRKVLRGGAWATSARIARPGYRNFFTPERNDVLAGFRTCAL